VQRIPRDRISYVFDRRLEPVLRVADGEVFQVETEDSRTGQTRTPETTRPEYVKALRGKGRVLRGWGRAMASPRVETPTHLVTVGAASPAESAQWLAVREMIRWLEERQGWTKDNARKLLALTGDLRPGQVQVPPYTMRLLVPKEHLPPARGPVKAEGETGHPAGGLTR
jgi:acetamidase/formamidase